MLDSLYTEQEQYSVTFNSAHCTQCIIAARIWLLSVEPLDAADCLAAAGRALFYAHASPLMAVRTTVLAVCRLL